MVVYIHEVTIAPKSRRIAELPPKVKPLSAENKVCRSGSALFLFWLFLLCAQNPFGKEKATHAPAFPLPFFSSWTSYRRRRSISSPRCRLGTVGFRETIDFPWRGVTQRLMRSGPQTIVAHTQVARGGGDEDLELGVELSIKPGH